MNPYTFLFCLLPMAIAALGPMIVIAAAIGKISQRRQIDAQRERALKIREADAMRRRELHEAKLARENNLVVLQDTRLELELLKIEALKRNLGLNSSDFQTNDYSSDRDPFTPAG